MKRSEMIEKLAAKIDDFRKMELEDIDAFHECAANFLAYLEHEGMAPPEVAEPVQTSVMVATPHGWQEHPTGTSISYVRKWEDGQ